MAGITDVPAFVAELKALSAPEKQKELRDYLSKYSKQILSLGNQLSEVLSSLDQNAFAPSFVAILLARVVVYQLNEDEEQFEVIYRQVADFISTCTSAQIRSSPAQEYFCELIHVFTEITIKRRIPMRALRIVELAVNKLKLSNQHLTPIHADYIQLCLAASHPSAAIELINLDITEVQPAERDRFDPKYYLLYFYYSGVIFCSLKRYLDALFCFEVVITTPAKAISHIMVDALKKYILVSLLLNRKLGEFPRHMPAGLQRSSRQFAEAYIDLALAFSSHDTLKFRQLLETHTELFTRDGNMGMVKQIQVALNKCNIQRLTQTFITLSVSDMTRRAQLESADQAEALILSMIESGEIFATIDRQKGMLKFHDNSNKYDSPATLLEISKEIESLVVLDRRLQSMEEEIILNPVYIKRAVVGGVTADEDPIGQGALVTPSVKDGTF